MWQQRRAFLRRRSPECSPRLTLSRLTHNSASGTRQTASDMSRTRSREASNRSAPTSSAPSSRHRVSIGSPSSRRSLGDWPTKVNNCFYYPSPDADHVVDALDAVEQYRLDGLVLASSTISQEHLVRMRRPGPRVVAFNQPSATGLLPLVSVDNEAGTSALVEHVAAQGVATALFVGGVAAASTDQMRYRGAAKSLGNLGIACPYIEAGTFTYDAGYKVASQISETLELPDVVMVGSDEVAFGVIDGLRTAGVNVPGDVLVTGFDGLPQASWAGYGLTTLVQPIDGLVDEAIAMLLDGEDPGERSRIIPGTVYEGRTTRRIHD